VVISLPFHFSYKTLYTEIGQGRRSDSDARYKAKAEYGVEKKEVADGASGRDGQIKAQGAGEGMHF